LWPIFSFFPYVCFHPTVHKPAVPVSALSFFHYFFYFCRPLSPRQLHLIDADKPCFDRDAAAASAQTQHTDILNSPSSSSLSVCSH
jgi:hypothetical protein